MGILGMNLTSRSRLAGIALVAASATCVAGLAPADAAPDSTARISTSAALDAAGGRVAAPQPVVPVADGLATADGRVRLSPDAAGSVRIRDAAGAVSISLPGGAGATAEATADGVVYRGVAAATDLVAAPIAGGAQLMAVLESSSAPRAIPFDVDAGPGTDLVANADGSVDVVSTRTTGAGSTVTSRRGVIAAPWAVDATGAAVATRYVLQGNRLVQVVQPSASTVYPVTADPSVKIGLTGVFIHWSRSDAKRLAGVGIPTVAAVLATLCPATGPYVALCVGSAAGISSLLRSYSDSAIDAIYDSGRRVTTRVVPIVLTYIEKR